MKNRPSTHLLLLLLLAAVTGIAHWAIIRAGVGRGFQPSGWVALRNIGLFLPLLALFFWLVRSRRYRGDLVLLTAAAALFAMGQVAQYRLFTDPEYGRGGGQGRAARLEKTEVLQQRYVDQWYDEGKKRVLFGEAGARPPRLAERLNERSDQPAPERSAGGGEVLTSLATWVPLLALLGLVVAYRVVEDPRSLLWLQRHGLVLGIGTTIPLVLMAGYGSQGGKFLGRTTPWEPVKIAFLLSYAGVLTDQYRHLSRTWWGIPAWRVLIPLLLLSTLPLLPFFILADFGQMLIFVAVYLGLYLVAVRRLRQLLLAPLLLGLLLSGAVLAGGAYQGLTARTGSDGGSAGGVVRLIREGIPRRIHQRFYLWLQGEVPPDPDLHPWWAAEVAAAGRGGADVDLWYKGDAYQPLQALFGVAEGGLLGKGLGRGVPESVPIADSDFVYATIAEEMGLLGGLIVLLGMAVLVRAGLRTAIAAPDMFTKLIAAGGTVFLGFQAIVNIGGVVRLLPMTGITLPFVSHGGWSLVTSFWILGMLMAISHRNRMDGV
jgi:cell division protein FtsW (lipid II flippase)